MPGSESFSRDIDAEAVKHILSLTVQPNPKDRSLSTVLTYLKNSTGLINSLASPAADEDIQEIKSNYACPETLEEAAVSDDSVD